MAPKPIPASTTASMIANAVGDDATNRRRNRNQTSSRQRRMHPVPKLTRSRRHGGRYLASKRKGNLDGSDLSPLYLATNTAIARSEERRVGKSVDVGGGRIIKKN